MAQTGAVAVLQEVVGVLAVLQRCGQRTPYTGEPLCVPIAASAGGYRQGSSRLDPYFEVLTGSDNMA